MNLTLDANVVIEIMRARQPHFRDQMGKAKAAGASLHISSIVLNELAYGALRSQRPTLHLERLDAFVSGVEVDVWTGEDAMATARLRTDLERLGQGIGTFDMMIAGQAVQRGWTVVTANLREFIRVPNLPLLDWSDPAGPVDRDAAWRRLMQKPPK